MVKEYKKEDVLKWFCGFYEGEGWVSNDIGNNNRLRLGIAQNDKTPLEIGKQIWGGSIKMRIRKSPASDKICTGYEWVLPHTKSLEFISDIKPHMLIPTKIQQINKVIDKFKNGSKIRYTCSKCEKSYANPSAKARHCKKIHQHTDASSEMLRENQTAGTS